MIFINRDRWFGLLFSFWNSNLGRNRAPSMTPNIFVHILLHVGIGTPHKMRRWWILFCAYKSNKWVVWCDNQMMTLLFLLTDIDVIHRNAKRNWCCCGLKWNHSGSCLKINPSSIASAKILLHSHQVNINIYHLERGEHGNIHLLAYRNGTFHIATAIYVRCAD